jgi:hypothetical protein
MAAAPTNILCHSHLGFILLTAAVVKAVEADLASEQALSLGVLDEREVNKDVLLWHLDGEGALRADAAHCAVHLHRAHVLEAPRQDVHRDERACGGQREDIVSHPAIICALP